MNKINFTREVFNKQKFNETVNTEFSQLVTTPDETFFDPNLATVEDFFTIYESLFLEIPQRGENNSHEFLIKESTEYIGFEQQNETIQELLEEITQLREENLEIRQQNLDLIQQFSEGITSEEARVVATGTQIIGNSTSVSGGQY
jgi:tRNA G46 methylase TrmB